ncbi:MAG: hypothetical protein E6R11_04610 [Rhodocyclaceae bacterium]|nr:MAG: hypothetical protein E6R11_04610 [Rhodocyclaceae bacterium]
MKRLDPHELAPALALAAMLACTSPCGAADGGAARKSAPAAAGLTQSGDACSADSDCVSIATVSPACRHVDPKAAQVCPGVDRRRAAEFGRVDCAVSNPCRAAAGYRCSEGRCKARE